MEYVMAASRLMATLISVYTLLIWIRVVFTWVHIPGQRPEDTPLLGWLCKIVDPYLHLFSGTKWARRGMVDFSPIIALALLSLLQGMFSVFGAYGRLSPGMVGALTLQTLWGYLLSPLFWFAMVLLGVRLFFCYYRSPNTLRAIMLLDRVDRSLLDFTQRLFFGHRAVSIRTLVWTSFVFFVALYALCRWGINLAIGELSVL